MNTPTTTPLLVRLTAVCRQLIDQLAEHALSADNFDEDAFIACEMAETLLADVGRVYGPLDEAQGLSEVLTATRERVEAGIDL